MTINETAPSVSPTRTRPLRDVRGFWRVLLAVIAPLPMLFMGIKYALSPDDGAETFEQTVTLYAQHKDQLELLEVILTQHGKRLSAGPSVRTSGISHWFALKPKC